MMHHVRPYKLFTLIDGSDRDNTVRIPIPKRRGTGGLSLLETFSLIAAAKLVDAQRIFEIGTYLGTTTLNLALNVREDSEILTLDLDEEQAALASQHPADSKLTKTHLDSQKTLDFLETPVSRKVKTLTGDSKKFDFSPWKACVDLIFIDGGHDFATVKSDTENAFELIRTDRRSCILWHDYGNPEYSALTDYLEELSQRLEIFHIEDTMLCVWFNNISLDISSDILKAA